MKDDEFIKQLVALGEWLVQDPQFGLRTRALLDKLSDADFEASQPLVRELLGMLEAGDLRPQIAGLPDVDLDVATGDGQWIELSAIPEDQPGVWVGWVVDVLPSPDSENSRLIKVKVTTAGRPQVPRLGLKGPLVRGWGPPSASPEVRSAPPFPQRTRADVFVGRIRWWRRLALPRLRTRRSPRWAADESWPPSQYGQYGQYGGYGRPVGVADPGGYGETDGYGGYVQPGEYGHPEQWAPYDGGEPAAPPVAPATIHRIPHITVGERAPIRVGARFVASVFLNEQPFETGEVGEPMVMSDVSELRLGVVLTSSPHFVIEGDGRGEILVTSAEPQSTLARFILRRVASDAPNPGIAATFYHGWRPVGRVARQLEVEGAEANSADQPGRMEPVAGEVAIDPAAIPPDLTVTVRRAPGGDERTFDVTVASPHLARFVDGVTVRWDLPSATREMVQTMVGRFLKTRGGRLAALIGAGRRLFDATPQEFRDAYWELVAHFASQPQRTKTLLVVTDEPHIPWELMVPDVRNGKFRPALGVEFAMGRWVHPNLVSPEQSIRFDDSWVIAPEYLPPLNFSAGEARFVKETFNGEQVKPARVDTIDQELGARGASLLHFICHGSSDDAIQILKLDPDEELTDIQVEGLPGLVAALDKHKPFVFLNACAVGQTIPALVGPAGFPAVFTNLGARAVVAPIWGVRDSVAAQVARKFYAQIKGDPTLPFSEAMREIRKLAYEGRDPEDSYAAYCFYGDPNSAQTRSA